MDKDISPEERLFHVVKAGKIVAMPVAVSQTMEVPLALENPLLFEMGMGLGKLDFKKVNAVLTGILIVLMLAVVLTVRHRTPLKTFGVMSQERGMLRYASPLATYPSLDFYLKAFGKRDVFRPISAVSDALTVAVAVTNKDFSLSGIYMGQYPQVIITDKAESKAYFLKVGDSIKGYKVVSIEKDKVELQQGDERVELS